MAQPNWRSEHLRSLRENQSKLHAELRSRGTLQEHLDEVERTAQEMYELEMRRLSDPSLQLSSDQIERVAQELVRQEIVLVRDRETLEAERTGYLG